MHKRGLCRHAVSVRLCVCPSRSYILSKRINISSIFSPSCSHTILVFQYQTAWQYADGNSPNGELECSWGGISQSVNVATASCYKRDCRSLLELVLSTDGGPSSGVSQSRCKSVYGTESHAPVNTSKREYNLIHAAENLTREYN